MFKLSRKQDRFYTMFTKNAEMAQQAAKLLKEYAENPGERQDLLKEIKLIERKGDKAVRDVIEELSKTFLTPFDREDIYAIAKEMDDILDYIERSASRFDMFNVMEPREGTTELCDMIIESTNMLVEVTKDFHNMGKNSVILEKLEEINKIEEKGDIMSRNAIKQLFLNDVEAIEVIKWREIYKHLENTLDSAQRVANLIEGVVMKNA